MSENQPIYRWKDIEIPLPKRTQAQPNTHFERGAVITAQQEWDDLCGKTMRTFCKFRPDSIINLDNFNPDLIAEEFRLSKFVIRKQVLALSIKGAAFSFGYRCYNIARLDGGSPVHDPAVFITRVGLAQLHALTLAYSYQFLGGRR